MVGLNDYNNYYSSYNGFYQEARITYVTSLEEALSKCNNRSFWQ